MDKNKIKQSFKLARGSQALEAVMNISKTTYRHLTGALEYLILKGYKQHNVENKKLK